jgi:hypothetical protein
MEYTKWMLYFNIWEEDCYKKGQLVDDLDKCAQIALGESHGGDKMKELMKEFEEATFNGKKIDRSSAMYKPIVRNHMIQEQFLSVVPSMKINDQTILVNLE